MPTTILAVDDNPADQQLVRRLLSKLRSDVRLLSLSDGEEALRYLLRVRDRVDPEATPRPDLILLDINLPRIAGPEVLHHVRSHPNLAAIPVIIVSSSTYERDIDACKRHGCDEFVTKSIDLDAYRARLLTAIRKILPDLV
jgi:CheY-like chemotaxis protein